MSHLTESPTLTRNLPPGVQLPGDGSMRFSLDAIPERDRLEVFRDFYKSWVIPVDAQPMSDQVPDVNLTLRALPGLQLAMGKMQGIHGLRTRAMAGDGTDDLGLMINLGGPYALVQGGRELVLECGEATVLASTDACSCKHYPPGILLGLRLPRARIAPLVGGIDDCHLRRIPGETPALTMLKGYVRMAWDEQTIATGSLQDIVVSHLHDLVAVAIGATRDTAETAQGRGVRAARLHAIKQDIARNLDQPDLSVTVLAARHSCTPRFIQRLFEAEGTTFTEYVLAQRLLRAHRMLTDPRHAHEKITTIALDAGFADVSYFNRAFRQLYGDTPSGVRAGRTLN
jgi:AraC-like DNA-binding protein